LISLVTLYLATENPIAQIGITNLTGYRLSTAYSLGSRLCQDILQMKAGYTKAQATSNKNMEKWILGYCNDLMDEIVGIGPPVTGAFRSCRIETAFLRLVICLSVKPLRCGPKNEPCDRHNHCAASDRKCALRPTQLDAGQNTARNSIDHQ